jgi:hypothetical protein
MKLKLAMFCGLLLAGANAMACYTVYDASNRVIYQGVDAPIDMSQPISETLGRRYPGAHMVFDLSTNCTPVRLAQLARPTGSDVPPGTIRMERSGRTLSPPSSSAPLLTDIDTAQRNHLPHTVTAGNIAVVPAQVAARMDLPTYTTIPAAVQVARAPAAPDTAVLGAGPARAQPARPQTIITELRDGSTIVERRVISVQ